MSNLKIIVKGHALFIFLLTLCAVLRLLPLFHYQYTLDELSGLSRTQFSSFSDLIEKGVKTTDTHPALIQVFIFCLAKCFGYTNWVIKLPFLLFGFGAIVYAYAFCLRHFSKQAGIFATVLLSFSLIFVYYAPIARMYIPGAFFSVALLFYFFELLFLNNTKLKNYVLFGLFALLSALNQHLNCLFALTVCASGILFLNKSNAKAYLLTCVLVVLLYLPHLPVTLYQFSIGGIGFDQDGWLPRPQAGVIMSFLKVLLGTGKSWMVTAALIVLSLVLRRTLKLNKKQAFLLLIFMVNYLVIYFYSVYSAPVFQNSVMLFAAMALVLFVASLLEFQNRSVFYSAVVVLSAVLLYKTYFKKAYYAQCVKTIFEYQFERSLQYKQLLGDQAVYPVFFDADTFMKKIYFEKYQTCFDCKITGDSAIATMRQFSQFIKELDVDYVVLASSMPAQQALVQEYFPYLIENTQNQALNFKVYSRRESDKNKIVKDDVVLKYSDVMHPGDFNYSKLKPEFIKGTRFELPVDSAIEFPFDATAAYNAIVESEGEELLLKTTFKLQHPENSKVASCISVNDAASNTTYMYNSRETGDFVSRPDSSVTVYADNFFGTAHRHAQPNGKIGCYIWNKGKENFKLTGFEIKIIDYWHDKWHYWE